MSQPLDLEAWDANRLRVGVRGTMYEEAQVKLKGLDRDSLSAVEMLGSTALLHIDPTSDAAVVVEIEAPAGSPYDLAVTWPNPRTSKVTRYHYEGVPASYSGLAVLTLKVGRHPTLIVDGSVHATRPTKVETEPEIWDAPDLVWVAGILPASDVAKGLGISLLAGLLPTLIYVTVLYHSDRYEKEPKPLLAAAFLWGALPALIVAIIIRLFFRLPVDLLGPEAIEAVRAGLVAPLIEEAVKGLAVIFIAVRYRREFDDVLDGIIYGAMAGFGFAMTGNTLSYIGAFLLRGFQALNNTIFIEGVLYGLNHGFYTAIFGAGLGYARLAQRRWQRWAVPLAAFNLAVTSHILHNLAIRNTLGLNLLTVAATWIGVLVIVVVMAWSLRRQQRCLETELVGEISEGLYRTLTSRGGRSRAQWRSFLKSGLRGLRRERRIHQLCAELAFKKMQFKLRPEEVSMLDESCRLREELQAIIDGE
jgi:RsiW-degrading membrane proteinase PrsW (M82 family)